MTPKDIRRLFELLNAELAKEDVSGELFVVGGAVMCLAYAARESTRDVDALFRPASKVRAAAARIAARAGAEANWLNDGVKGYLSGNGAHLRVMVAQPEYMLAMKCLSMRIGEEFHAEDDVRYLLRHLGIETYEAALEIIARFYPAERFPQKTLSALEELTAKRSQRR